VEAVVRRIALLIGAIGVALVLVSGGVALAKTFTCKVGVACVGTEKADTITGTNKADKIRAKGGSDTINANGGKDTINGGPGNDAISGAGGVDTIRDKDGPDLDFILGGPGNDFIDVLDGDPDDVVCFSDGTTDTTQADPGDRINTPEDCA
jgi:Ca2+-binding RTX toxin-like protein